MHGSMRRVRQKFAETEMNRHFGKTLVTQDSHIHQTTISFTYTSNHHKLHIHFTYTSKPPQASHIHQTTTSFTYTLHIYIKPPQASHIHFTYTSNRSFTYTSNPKLIKASMGDKWKKGVGRRSTYFNMKQSRFK